MPISLMAIALQAIAIFLFILGLTSFRSLLRGCFVLRRLARTGRHNYTAVLLKSPLAPPISTIACPPDASAESVQFARRLLELHYGRNEVVIVLDGPSEEELDVWRSEFKLCTSARVIGKKLPTAAVRGIYESKDPIRVVVIDKERGGPVDAWNSGVNASTSPVIGILDPSTDFHPEILLRMIQPTLEIADETIAMCAGVPAPTGKTLTGRLAALESQRAWMIRGAAYSQQNRALPFPGSALLVRRDAVLQAKGFAGGSLELVMRLHGLNLVQQKPYRIAFLPDPVCHSRTPAAPAEWRSQIRRDQRELVRAFRQRVAVAGPYGWQLLRGLFFSQVVRPWLETIGYLLAVAGLALRSIDLYTVLFFLLSSIGMGIVVSMAAVVLRELAETNPDQKRMAALFSASFPENLGYRQLRNFWLIAASLR